MSHDGHGSNTLKYGAILPEMYSLSIETPCGFLNEIVETIPPKMDSKLSQNDTKDTQDFKMEPKGCQIIV